MQKIAFIRALLSDIDILLLDESTANLDDYSSKKIFELLIHTWEYKYNEVTIPEIYEFLSPKNNIKTIYDLTTPYWRYKQKILHEELKLQPDWNLSSTEIFSPEKCKDKDEELNLSDKVIVASSFTAKSLSLFNKKNQLNDNN